MYNTASFIGKPKFIDIVCVEWFVKSEDATENIILKLS